MVLSINDGGSCCSPFQLEMEERKIMLDIMHSGIYIRVTDIYLVWSDFMGKDTVNESFDGMV